VDRRAHRVGTKVGRAGDWTAAAALAAVCALAAGVAPVAAVVDRQAGVQGASNRSTGQTHWVARPLGKVLAVGINNRGEIAGYEPEEGWPWGRRALLWKNGRWRDLGTLGGEVTFLPAPPLENGNPLPTAAVINDRGQVVGISEPPRSHVWHGVLWQNGRMRDLGTLQPIEINERGQVVGDRETGRKDSEGTPLSHAFLWQNGNLRDLGTLGRKVKGSITVADINDDGQVVGSSGEVVGSIRYVQGWHAFLWEKGKMRDLGTLGGDESNAVAVNNRGQIVGSAESIDKDWHAFLWQDGQMRDLGRWWPIAINDRGQIVGSMRTGSGRVHAVLWQDGSLRDLGVLAGDRHSGPIGINERGQIIGVSYDSLDYLTDEVGPFEISGMRPFVWENGRMRSLPGIRPGTEGAAVAINNSGQVIGWNGAGSVLWTSARRT
jgi:probable HAF family extracellular repeat protein